MIIEHFLTWMQTAPVPKRAQAVNALARAYLYSDMSNEERITAESALTILLEDPSSTVRFALADALASSKKAPRHIIMGLATDTTEIATMILSRSPVLMTGELVDLVASGTVEQQIAIACRGHINSALCGAIAEVGVVEACLGLLMNKEAKHSKKILHRIAERHGADVEIRKLMLSDIKMDAEIRLLLLEKLGDNLGNFVTERNWIPKPRVQKSIRDALDKSSIQFAVQCDEPQVEQLVDTLIRAERLTTGYLLRAICMGNITLFCTAISRLTAIPAERIEAMISQKRHAAFRAAFVKSGMPVQAYEVFSTALGVWQSLLSGSEGVSRARMPYLVTRRVVGKYRVQQNAVVDELLMLLRRISSDLARDEARTHVLDLARKRDELTAKSCSSSMLQLTHENGQSESQNTDDIRLIDEQFVRDMEETISLSLENDVIEISENDMRIPDAAANDTPIDRCSEPAELLEVSPISSAA